MDMYEYWLRFNWSLFLKEQLLYSNFGSDNGLTPVGLQAIVWTNDSYFTDAYMRHSVSGYTIEARAWLCVNVCLNHHHKSVEWTDPYHSIWRNLKDANITVLRPALKTS